jgi:hypothetical protein
MKKVLPSRDLFQRRCQPGSRFWTGSRQKSSRSATPVSMPYSSGPLIDGYVYIQIREDLFFYFEPVQKKLSFPLVLFICEVRLDRIH